jgi:hypothetical protein
MRPRQIYLVLAEQSCSRADGGHVAGYKLLAATSPHRHQACALEHSKTQTMRAIAEAECRLIDRPGRRAGPRQRKRVLDHQTPVDSTPFGVGSTGVV